MNITLSVATSIDHYIDDMTPQRLTLSTASDWAEVYRLRSEHDAILVGGETLRRDNPSLGLKGVSVGREPMRVIVSGHGEIPLSSKIFHQGGGRIVIFSNIERKELSQVADVIVAPLIDVALIVTELEKRHVRSLFVEGGAKILSMFLDSGAVNTLRVAVNPTITVGDSRAPRFDPPQWLDEALFGRRAFDEMEVTTYYLNQSAREITQSDMVLMSSTIDYSRQSPPKDSCYRVGATIVTAQGVVYEGYTLQTSPTHHAEQAAMKHALDAGADLHGATIYASMEPCSQRSSEPESCSELILRHGISRVLFALYEPSHFVECHGAENLRRAGVAVIHMDEFAQEVKQINRHVLSDSE